MQQFLILQSRHIKLYYNTNTLTNCPQAIHNRKWGYSGLNMRGITKKGPKLNSLKNPWGKNREQKKNPPNKRISFSFYQLYKIQRELPTSEYSMKIYLPPKHTEILNFDPPPSPKKSLIIPIALNPEPPSLGLSMIEKCNQWTRQRTKRTLLISR